MVHIKRKILKKKKKEYLCLVSIYFWLENQLFAVVSVTMSKHVRLPLMGSFIPLKTPGSSGGKTELAMNFLTVFFLDDLLYFPTGREEGHGEVIASLVLKFI